MNKAVCLLFVATMVVGSAWSASIGRGGGTVVAHPDTGSDSWGYTWFRSDEPGGPTFHWVDIIGRGTLVSGLYDDNYVGPFSMQFEFPYYWYRVSSFYVGSNGYINFSSPANFSSPFARLPATGALVPRDLLAICTGDLDFSVAATNPQCYYWTNGSDSLVVSFINVAEWHQTPDPNLRHTFQVILCKRDSSITYQYGAQQGGFNAADNYALCIGWQDMTGQIGRSYTYSTTPPHVLMPDSGLAIQIRKVWTEHWYLPDGGIVGGFDSTNQARVLRMGIADTIRCVVRNFGTDTIVNARVRYAITKTGQVPASDTVLVSLGYGRQATVTFPRLFTPPVNGTYSALFNIRTTDDVSPGNDSKTAEILSASFGADQSTLIQFENGVESGSVSWPDSGGFGVAIDLPPGTYPVRVETVYVRIGSIMTQPLTVEILDGSSGAPGTVLATRTVTATASGMNAVAFTTDNIVIPGGRFFVGARGAAQFSYENLVPISQRTWEYTNGWAPYRAGDTRDIIMRASVRSLMTGAGTGVAPDGFVLGQNYPNPFNPATTISFSLPSKTFTSLKVFDALGREVSVLVSGELSAGTHSRVWNAAGAASGVYFYRLTAGARTVTRKLVLLR